MNKKIHLFFLSLLLMISFAACDLFISTEKEQISTPVITPGSGVFMYSKEVSISCSTNNVSIRYTLDGSTPTSKSGILYSGPFLITSDTTVYAIAYKEGYVDSDMVRSYIEITGRVSIPELSLDSGTYTEAQTVSISCETEDVDIYYTTDNSIPSESNGMLYENPFDITSSSIVKVIAYRDNWEESVISSETYTITGTLSPPVFSIEAGIYTTAQEIEIYSSGEGVSIRYTTDGTVPSATNGTLYTNPVYISDDITIKAIAYMNGWEESVVSSTSYIITGIISAPIFDIDGGTYTTVQTLSISCQTEGVDIYYTTDDSVPSEDNGMLYISPIDIDSTMTLKARAFFEDWEESVVVEETYVITGSIDPPSFTHVSGIYTTPQAVGITCDMENVFIRYTIDGTIPSSTTGILYTEPIIVSEDITIKAIAYLDEWDDSVVNSVSYTITGTVSTPVISLESGTYTSTQMMVLSCLTEGASIYYTTDNTTPSINNGTLYTGPVDILESKTIKVIAILNNWEDSMISEESYVITGICNTPSFTIESGIYTTQQVVQIFSDMEDVSIRYTVDGTIPTSTIGISYTEPIIVSEDMTIKAIVYKNNWEDSEIISTSYIITGTVATPVISLASGTYTSEQSVTISCETDGASIYYTTDGSTPTSVDGVLYNGSFVISKSSTIKTRAYLENWEESLVQSETYTITGTLNPPIFSIDNGIYTTSQQVEIFSIDEGSSIKYTTDGTNPSSTTGTLYISPIDVTEDMTIKAIAYLDGWDDSNISSVSYVITGTVVTPVISLDSGTYTTSQLVSISSETIGVSIYYTTDGSIPSKLNGSLYTGSFNITESQTIKAIAILEDWADSSISEASFTITGRCSAPVFDISPGIYTSSQTVSISSDMDDASIRYTIDGTTPTSTTGILYTSPIDVTEDMTIKAVTYLDGWDDSNISSVSYVITGTVVTPVISLDSGTYTTSQLVSISSETIGVSIYYTTDGSTPSELNGSLYTGSFSITESQTIKAIAILEDWADSSISEASYTITGRCSSPVFDISPGIYTSSQTVSISSDMDNVSIRYTIDGTTPSSTTGTLYTSPIDVTEDMTIKAVTYLDGWDDSNISSVSYIITGTVVTPVISLDSGTYTTSQLVSISSDTIGVSIYYTTDGSTPSELNGSLYTGAFNITESQTIKAIAILENWADSSISEGSYTITGRCSTPVFDISPGIYTSSQTVSISSDMDDVSIRYTIDGTTPSSTTGTLYTSPIDVTEDMTIKAVTYLDGWDDSNISSVSYIITGTVVTPVISLDSGTYTTSQLVTISSDTIGVSIYYTTDGSTPSELNGSLYTGSFNITESQTIKAIAILEDWADSSISEASYIITGRCNSPVFDISPGIYTSSQTVSISSDMDNVSIRYTTDGTTPSSTTGTLYTSPIDVTEDMTIKAVTYLDGWDDSNISSVSYIITGTVVTPVITPETGLYTDVVTISISCQTSGALIYYTTNGSLPNEDNGTLYTGTFEISEDTTVSAAAFLTDWEQSSIIQTDFAINLKVGNPTVSLSSGTYNSTRSVSISCDTSGSSIYYTTDGTTPSVVNGTLYIDQVIISEPTSLKVIAIKDGYADSEVVTNDYIISEIVHEGITYKIYNDEYRVYSCDYSVIGEVTILSEWGGVPVTSIYGAAFYFCSSVTKINLPDTIKSIGMDAFKNCSSLESINLPASITSISDNVFYGCKKLNNVILPEGLTTISSYLFYNCDALTSIEIPASVTTIESNAFKSSGLTTITIPSTVTGMEHSVFDYCLDLTSAQLDCNITTLPYATFSDCRSLTDVTLPESLQYLDGEVFYNCDLLTSVNLPQSIIEIGYRAFADCINLSSITLPDGLTKIGGTAFDGCTSLSTIEIPETVTYIGQYAFRDCTSLINLISNNAFNNLEFLGKYAFDNCQKISSFNISDKLTVISEGTFQDCFALTDINIPDGITDIERYAFKGCSQLKNPTTFSNNLVTIGDSAFFGCSSITELNLPSTLTTLGAGTFSGCDSLTSITIPENITTIPNACFSSSELLETVVLPDGITSIGDNAFHSCEKLHTINFPDTLISIGSGAFVYTMALEVVDLPDSVEVISRGAFSHAGVETLDGDYDGNIYFPANLKEIGVNAFEYTRFGDIESENVILPESLTTIGEGAFRYQSGIKSINIPSGITVIEDETFYGSSTISDMYIYSPIAPSIGINALSRVTSGTIHIISGSSGYESNGWEVFTVIEDLN